MVSRRNKQLVLGGLLVASLTAVIILITLPAPRQLEAAPPEPLAESQPTADSYIVLSWNDLGMHCYNRDFQDL
ncbi:MAG: hypothetical protein KC441_03385, partial [Anaerolineales bacterium]|nr:hypothetical protein [Anaerolineales bacterium]